MYDAEGSFDGPACPACGATPTVTWRFDDGIDEIECRQCGYHSEGDVAGQLLADAGDVLTSTRTAGVPLRRTALDA